MPANIPIMFGASPPFPSESSIFNSFYKGNTCYSQHYDVFHNRSSFNRVPRLSLTNPKSCLKSATKQIDEINEDSTKLVNDETTFCLNSKMSTKKAGKRVRFADSHGGVLTLIKHLTESSNEPPKSLSSQAFLKDLMKKMTIDCNNDEKDKQKLVLHFNQPVADFSNFKRLLDHQSVCLENLVVKNENCIQGTIKVKNIAYEKLVTVRITFDEWQSSTGVPCEYVVNSHESGGDTFQFTISIASDVTSAQFCIRYQADKQEFWDNNNNRNYNITRTKCMNQTKTPPMPIPSRPTFPNGKPYPTTYCELPSPQDPTWIPLNNDLRFY